MKRTNMEGGLDFDDGLGTKKERRALASAKRVAWKRQARAYRRLRDRIDAHYLKHLERAPDVWLLPHRLSGWKSTHSALVRQAYPEMDGQVREIEALLATRRMQKADRSFIPRSTYKRVPWPADLKARKAEITRRAAESMRRLRLARKYGPDNLDLVGL